MIYNSLRVFSYALILSLCGMLFAVVKNDLNPVMAGVYRTTPWDRSEIGTVSAKFLGDKIRDCKRIPDSEHGYMISVEGIQIETQFRYVGDLTPNSSFPPGIFEIGTIEWVHPDVSFAKMVGFTIEHYCVSGIKESDFWFEILSLDPFLREGHTP